jgi:nucleotide-binding universal stress UspA family protein/CHAD domain-containing protein
MTSALVADVTRRLQARATLLQRCRKSPTVRSVHRLRVESRRLLARLELLADVLPAWVGRSGCRAVRKQLKTLGELRDLQVHLGLVRELFPQHPELQPFLLELRQALVIAIRQARRRLARPKPARRLRDLAVELAGVPETGDVGVDAMQRPLREARGEVVRRAAAAHEGSGLHRLRLALKRCRYLTEALQPILPASTPAQLARLRAWRRVSATSTIWRCWKRACRRLPGSTPSPAGTRAFAGSSPDAAGGSWRNMPLTRALSGWSTRNRKRFGVSGQWRSRPAKDADSPTTGAEREGGGFSNLTQFKHPSRTLSFATDVKTVLAPIDFSRVSRRVIHAAIELARLLQARVVLLHAVPPSAGTKPVPPEDDPVRLARALERVARQHLTRWQRELARGRIAVAARCSPGEPVPAILRAAGELRANYIVLGSHGRQPPGPRILGGTSSGVIAGASCPVVVIPIARRRSPRRRA